MEGVMRSVKSDMELTVRDYRLVLAEIRYYFPDHPTIICPHTFTWQRIDLPPKLPLLVEFLNFWENSLDGKLHSVKVASAELIEPSRFRHANTVLRLH
jgi:uncharacterized protein Usg